MSESPCDVCKGSGKKDCYVLSTVEIKRFLEKISVSNINFYKGTSCWEWVRLLYHGYGHFWLNDKSPCAHRVSYEYLYGKIPEGLQLDHLCRNRKCVNPNHLEVVTCRENLRRGEHNNQNKGKTHCPQGHEYSPENTYIIPSTYGRLCRICQRIQRRQSRQRKKLEVII